MMKRLQKNEAGNGFLETIMFLPLAFLFLFTVTDSGLVLLERASLTDSLREGLNEQVMGGVGAGIFKLTSTLELELDQGAAQAAADKAAIKVGDNAWRAKVSPLGGASLSFKVEAALIIYDIDPETGALLGEDAQVLSLSPYGNPSFSLAQASPQYAYKTRDEFLQERLLEYSQTTPSPLAIETGFVTNELTHESQAQYYNKSAVLYANVEALPKAISPHYTNAILGSFAGVQAHAMSPVRVLVK